VAKTVANLIRRFKIFRNETTRRLYRNERAQRHDLHRRDLSAAEPKLEYRTGFRSGFSAKYGCKMLVWYELHETMETAILREKQIKGGSRKDKLRLIETMNPGWRDLYADIMA